MQINFGRKQGQQADRIAKARQEQAAARNEQMKTDGFLRYMQNSRCPYGMLAKNGVIQYNGVVFQCDYEHNTISLGDVTSDPKKVLNVALPSGGNLKINVDCFGDIARAAGMFSPEDLNAIMNAIHQYNYCTKKLNEIEEEKAKGWNLPMSRQKPREEKLKQLREGTRRSARLQPISRSCTGR